MHLHVVLDVLHERSREHEAEEKEDERADGGAGGIGRS